MDLQRRSCASAISVVDLTVIFPSSKASAVGQLTFAFKHDCFVYPDDQYLPFQSNISSYKCSFLDYQCT